MVINCGNGLDNGDRLIYSSILIYTIESRKHKIILQREFICIPQLGESSFSSSDSIARFFSLPEREKKKKKHNESHPVKFHTNLILILQFRREYRQKILTILISKSTK